MKANFIVLINLSLSLLPSLEWSRIIYNDGLMTTNQLLKSDCEYCAHTVYCPYLRNVVIVSVQPERNIQLFPTNGTY